MRKVKKILFIQHASAFGGSAMSLLYMLQGIRSMQNEDLELLIALAKWTPQLAEFYEKEGFSVVKNNWIETYEHTQGVHYNLLNPIGFLNEIKQLFTLSKAKKNTVRLLESVKPDIVHLNSVVLLGSALAVKGEGIPLVWHVREPSIKGIFGMRRSMIRHFLKKLANEIIFICKADMNSWGNPTNAKVVYNFVDFKRFSSEIAKPSEIDGIKIPVGDLNVLFLGGVSKIKGGIYLIRAINNLIKKYPEKKIYLLFPGGLYNKPNYFVYKLAQKILPLLGSGTYSQRIEKEISKSEKAENFIKLKFEKNVEQLIIASDVIVFPSIRPHFARPIIEAGAMGKPVIGSRLGGVEELIEDNANGFLVKPKSVKETAEKLDFLLNHKDERIKLGEKGYTIAFQKYQAKENIKAIFEVYYTL